MTTVPLFVNGEGMSGGKVHYSIEGNPFLGKARTAPRCRFFSVRDEFLALWPVNEDGASIEGELYEVQLAVVRDRFIPAEPPELELGVLELEEAAARWSCCCGNRYTSRARASPTSLSMAAGGPTAGAPVESRGDVMAEYDLVIRGSRIITRAGEVPRCVAVRDGVAVAIEPLEARLEGRDTVELRRRRGPAARRGRQPRARQRSPAPRSGRASRPPPARPRQAASRRSWTCRSTASHPHAQPRRSRSSDRPLRIRPTSTWVSGVTSRTCVARRGGLRLQVLHDAVRGRRVPPLDAEQIEDTTAIERAPAPPGGRYADFLASRPRGAENVAIAHLIEAARHTGAAVHLLHLSSSDAVPMLRTARRDGIQITAETCPHYVVFEAEAIADGSPQFKCCRPIREADNREALWSALARGDIDCIVSDHSPCTIELKRLDSSDLSVAWGGISSLQLGLPAVRTEARQRGHTLVDFVRWMAERPALIAGLQHKGQIERGYHADFAVFAPDDAFVVDAAPAPPQSHHPTAEQHGRGRS